VVLNAITPATPKFGSHVYLWELALELAKLEAIDLVLIVSQEQASTLPPALQHCVYDASISGGRSYTQLLKVGIIDAILRKQEADVYHLPNTMPLMRNRLPTVITIHDLVELRVRKYGVWRTLYRFLINLVSAHLADRIITVSDNSKNDIAHLLRVPRSKISVIYNGVNENFRPLERSYCRTYLASQYGIMSDFILAPGGLSRNKNIPRLLAAMAILKAKGHSHSLILLGDTKDAEFAAVSRAIRQRGLAETVKTPGFVPRKDLPFFYNCASLVLYPTLYEGFGLPVLEAMACGTPVVTSRTSSLPEISGGATLLVNPESFTDIADAADRLLTDSELRASLVSRGLTHARKFTWERAARETVAVFRDVANQRKVTHAYGSARR
jgi:glycosyltransferase involved in cell wall biosynthesis